MVCGAASSWTETLFYILIYELWLNCSFLFEIAEAAAAAPAAIALAVSSVTMLERGVPLLRLHRCCAMCRWFALVLKTAIECV